MIPVTSSAEVKSYKDERIARLQNWRTTVIQDTEFFSKMPEVTDKLSVFFHNEFWKRHLTETYKKTQFLVRSGMSNELFLKIEQLFQQHFHQSIIPETHLVNTKKEGLASISFETIFINLVQDHLKKVKNTFEQLSLALGMRTPDATKFHSLIVSVLVPTDYVSLKTELEKAREKDEDSVSLLKKCMGFEKKADFPNILSQPYLKVQAIFDNCIKEMISFHESWKSIRGPLQETELKVSDVDKIPLSDVKRSVLGDSGRNLEIYVNKEIPERLPSYYQALISLIDRFVQLPHREAEIVEFSKTLMRNEEVGAKYFSRILRLCSINAWSHASKMIEKAKAGFREVPFITKFKDGMQCEVSVYSRNDYEVSQSKTLLVYKRAKPKDKDCLIAEGEPVAAVTFKASFHVMNDSCRLILSIENWSINSQAEFLDKLMVYRILSSHATGARPA